MKYSEKGNKDRNRHKYRIKSNMQARLVYKDINRQKKQKQKNSPREGASAETHV